MKMSVLSSVALLTACAGAGLRAAPEPSQLDRRVDQAARQQQALLQTETIGQSRQGRPLHLLRLAAPGQTPPEERPALLIAAGLHGDHLLGTDVAMGVARALLDDHRDLLAETTIYIVPRLNPDAAAVHEDEGVPTRSFPRTVRPDDVDQDRRVDEDGPSDLNGDGVITMMRIENPPPGIDATLIIDDQDPRLLRAPKPEEGERATHAVLIEGVDADGDGAVAEDPVGGVMLDMNFPHHWPEHEDGAGPYPLSEPESLALARWMLDQDNIAAVLVFGPHDTLVSVPDAGQMDETGAVPKGVEEDDKPYYDKISEAFKEITKIKEAPKGDNAGAFHAWAYAQYGAPSFSTPVWVRPDQLEGAEDSAAAASDGDDASGDDADAAPGGMTTQDIQAMVARFQSASPEERQELMAEFREMSPAVRRRVMAVAQGREDPAAAGADGDGGPGGADPEDRKWLAYSDEQRDGAGFVEWSAFDHPQFGEVEIGGFVPGFKLNPPQEELARLVQEQTEFVADLAGRLPRVRIEPPAVEPLGRGVWRVRARVVNDGYFPTQTAMAKKLRRVTPTVMTLDLPEEAILAGDLVQNQRGIDGAGAAAEAEWIIAADPGDAVTLIVRSALIGERQVAATLGAE